MEDKKVILVEFALAAHELIKNHDFFDENGKPQGGTKLIDDTLARLTSKGETPDA